SPNAGPEAERRQLRRIEPAPLDLLGGGRNRQSVYGRQESDIEVAVRRHAASGGDGVHVEIERQTRHQRWREPGLFACLTKGGGGEVRIVGLDVTARLHPRA